MYKDEGISGAKGREQRPALDAILKDAARREFDQVAVWSVDGNVIKVSGHTQFLEGDLITVSASLQSLKELALQTATAPPSHGFV